ncbi:MAG: 50S ribosomal protein L22 [Gemmatimonadetes bacterium]|nr:50S ribosomal protein L22 [Gemmatimonadota bacterium]
MEARAIQRMVRQSPRKMRLVVDLIRGRPVNEAFSILKFSKKGAARQVSKVLLSAVANARERSLKTSQRLEETSLYVKAAAVDPGPMLKRFQPAAMGRATPLKKRTSHVTILVATKES